MAFFLPIGGLYGTDPTYQGNQKTTIDLVKLRPGTLNINEHIGDFFYVDGWKDPVVSLGTPVFFGFFQPKQDNLCQQCTYQQLGFLNYICKISNSTTNLMGFRTRRKLDFDPTARIKQHLGFQCCAWGYVCRPLRLVAWALHCQAVGR